MRAVHWRSALTWIVASGRVWLAGSGVKFTNATGGACAGPVPVGVGAVGTGVVGAVGAVGTVSPGAVAAPTRPTPSAAIASAIVAAPRNRPCREVMLAIIGTF